MAEYVTQIPIKRGGKDIPVGATLDLCEKEAAPLLLINAVTGRKASEVGKEVVAEKPVKSAKK